MRTFAFITLVIALIAAEPLQVMPAFKVGLPPGVEAAMNDIDAERLRAHTLFLGSDLLEGRYPGERGGEIATDYMATQFAMLKLQPAGDNGTYLQKIPMVFMKAQPTSQFHFVPRARRADSAEVSPSITAPETTRPAARACSKSRVRLRPRPCGRRVRFC